MIRESRQVGGKTILTLLTQKHIYFATGMIFTLLPFAMGAIFLFVISLIDADIPDADYERIRNVGKLTTATITSMEAQRNITINNEHPSIISYVYVNDDNIKTNGSYRSLEPDKIARLAVGDSIQIKYLADSSMIVGLEPFEFPFDLLLKILIPFLGIGLFILTLLGLSVRTKLNLYKYGEVKDAEVVSVIPVSGLPISGIGQGTVVHYQYKTEGGQSILGKSFIRDHTILHSKQGDLVKIFVSIENESKSCLIPKLEQIRNNWEIG